MPEEPLSVNDLHAAIVAEQSGLLDASMRKLHNCLSQLDDGQLWWCPQPAMNSVANLILHMTGNLAQWVISGFTSEPDVRDRTGEFQADGGVSRADLLARLESTVAAARGVLQTVTPADLLEPREIQGFSVSGLGAIVHSVTHFVGHVHQVIQLTRLQLGDGYQFEWSPAGSRDQVPL